MKLHFFSRVRLVAELDRLQPGLEQVRVWRRGERENPPQEAVGARPAHVQQVRSLSLFARPPAPSTPPSIDESSSSGHREREREREREERASSKERKRKNERKAVQPSLCTTCLLLKLIHLSTYLLHAASCYPSTNQPTKHAVPKLHFATTNPISAMSLANLVCV
jgi:hypothetical protein